MFVELHLIYLRSDETTVMSVALKRKNKLCPNFLTL